MIAAAKSALYQPLIRQTDSDRGKEEGVDMQRDLMGGGRIY